jgi:hypothetical protein
MPANAEDIGFISGPNPIGENQESAIEITPAIANGVNIPENVLAALVSQLNYSLTLASC